MARCGSDAPEYVLCSLISTSELFGQLAVRPPTFISGDKVGGQEPHAHTYEVVVQLRPI